MILVSHNAYWFQGAPSLWGQEQIRAHPAVLTELSRVYQELRPDVLCVQEVPDVRVVDHLTARLGLEGVHVRGGGRPGYGGAVLWRRPDGPAEPCPAVRDLTRTEMEDRGIPPFARICMLCTLPVAGRCITVINLHLASNRFAPDGRGESVRLRELATVFALIAEPDVIVGDFNAVPESQVYQAMVARGYQDAGRTHPAPGEHQPCPRIDYIWVRRDGPVELVRYGVVGDHRFRLRDRTETWLSDHAPVWVQLAIRRNGVTG